MVGIEIAAPISSSALSKPTSHIGELLQRARQQRQLEVADVATSLHLHLRQLQSLEAGDFSVFTNPVFVKGYLRAYARLVGLDGDELVSLYDATGPQIKSSSPLPPVLTGKIIKNAHSASRFTVLIACLLASTVVLLWQYREDSAGLTALFEQVFSLGRVRVLTAGTAAVDVPNDQNAAAESLKTGAGDKPGAEYNAGLSADVVGSESPLLNDKAVLRIAFVGECWVQIKDHSGNVLHEQLHRAGDHVSVPATVPVHLWFGNAAAVADIRYYDNPFSVPVRSGYQSSRFVLMDNAASNLEFE